LRDAEARLLAWEAGEKKPSIPQARKLAAAYRRPLSIFYLAEPPREEESPPDYRRAEQAAATGVSPELRWRIRHLRALREAALDLAEETPDAFPALTISATVRDDVDNVATALRDFLGVPTEEQLGWRSERRAWTQWRKAAEEATCLVFAMAGLGPDELDGFSLAYERAPVIAVNGSPALTQGRKVFTLIHELVHVALHSSGVCSLERGDAEVERFCNRVAAALLMPRDLFAAKANELAGSQADAWSNGRVDELATAFSVSRHAAFVRLVSLRIASQRQYEAWKALHDQPTLAPAHPPEEGEDADERRGPSFYTLYLYRMSFPYLRQVFESYHADRLSLSELSDHLGVKPTTALALEEHFVKRLRARAS
jgi:Zn-dependent peptidase ImmA (M78 family)